MAKSFKSRPTSKTARPAPLEGNEVWKNRSRVRRAGPVTREATLWETLPGWAQHAICLGFLLVVAVGFFAPSTIGGQTLAGGDTVQWRATAESMMAYEESSGRAALWAPNVYGGMPGYLIYMSASVPGVDSVVTGLRQIGFWPVAHFYALLLGTYLLVLFLTRYKWAGVISAVGFGLSTYLPVILSAGHNTKFVALAFTPWLLLGFAAVIRRDPGTGKMQSALLMLLFAIAAAVNLRAGHVQITYYAVVVAAVWWLAEGVAAARSGRAVTFVVSTALLLGGAALALAMVAHPYLAQWEYKAFSIRASGPGEGLAWEAAMAWSQGVGEMLTLLIADAYGGGGALYWGEKPFTAGPHYVGPAILLLALIGAAGVARRSVAAFGAAAVLLTLFAFGENVPLLNRPAFEFLPLFSSFRVPETWLSVVVLLLALLAGWGAYYLQRTEATPEAERRKRRISLGAAGALAVLVLGLWATGGAGLSFERAGERAQIEVAAAQQTGLSYSDPQLGQMVGDYLRDVRQQRVEVFTADAGRTALILLLATVLVALVLWNKVPSWVALAGLTLVVTVDLWGVGRRYFNEDIDALRSRSDVAASIPRTPTDDFLLQQLDAAGGPGHFRVLPPNPLANAVPSYYYESVGGYNAARLGLIQGYFDRLLPDSTGVNRNALRLLSTRYVLAAGPAPGFGIAFQDPQSGTVVLEDTTALPRAFLADSVAVVADDDAAIARIRSPRFDPRTTALVAELPEGLTADALTGPPPDSAGALVQLQRFVPDEIVWRVRTDRPRLLVASEVYYPAGWTATVGVEETPIVRTDYLLRGVPIPAGEHIVTMRYAPATYRQGRVVSWVASLLVYLGAIGLAGLLWYRRGHPVA